MVVLFILVPATGSFLLPCRVTMTMPGSMATQEVGHVLLWVP